MLRRGAPAVTSMEDDDDDEEEEEEEEWTSMAMGRSSTSPSSPASKSTVFSYAIRFDFGIQLTRRQFHISNFVQSHEKQSACPLALWSRVLLELHRRSTNPERESFGGKGGLPEVVKNRLFGGQWWQETF